MCTYLYILPKHLVDAIHWHFVLDLLYIVLSLSTILLSTAQKKKFWLVNIFRKSLGFTRYYQKELYVKCTMDLLLILHSLYGWQRWGKKQEKTITRTENFELAGLFFGCLLSSLFVGYLYSTYTSSYGAYLDALHGAFVLMTYWLLGRKKLEAWGFWGIANVFFVYLFWMRTKEFELSNYLFFGKYLLYTLLAMRGYYQWYAIYKQKRA